jgi:hypothetical protein
MNERTADQIEIEHELSERFDERHSTSPPIIYERDSRSTVSNHEPPPSTSLRPESVDDITNASRVEGITAADSLSPMFCSTYFPSTRSLDWHNFLNSSSTSSTSDVANNDNCRLDPNEQNQFIAPVKKQRQSLNAKQSETSLSPTAIGDRDSQFLVAVSSSIAMSEPFSTNKNLPSGDGEESTIIFDLDDSEDDNSINSLVTQEPNSNPKTDIHLTHTTISSEGLAENTYSTHQHCSTENQCNGIDTLECVREQSHNKVMMFPCFKNSLFFV